MTAALLSSAALPPLAPSGLPGVWHADELSGGALRTQLTGHDLLDAELPGGGWPLGAMTELLASPEAPVWSLMLPALAAQWQTQGEAVALISPPHEPFLPALAAAGLPPGAVIWVRAPGSARASHQNASQAALWAAEQSLRCADVGAVVAWLPGARTVDLRRLQAAAARRADTLLFVLRPESAAGSASPARVRLSVQGGRTGRHPQMQMQVHILKRRGPPMAKPLLLQAHDERLRAVLQAQFQAQCQAEQAGAPAADSEGADVLPFWGQARPPRQLVGVSSHALDRVAVAA